MRLGPGGTGLVEPKLHPDERAPSLDHNPSSMRQRHRIAAVALVAVAISSYMGLYQWGVIDSVWDPVFGTGTQVVLQSSASETMKHILGIPDAVMGLWAFPRPGPAGAQNQILVGLVLGLLSVVPSDANSPPEGWTRWFADGGIDDV